MNTVHLDIDIDIVFPPVETRINVQPLVDAILEQTQKKVDGSVRHAGNWPVDAVIAVEHSCHDRQFPDVQHSVLVDYFASIEEFDAWVARKREWIIGTDYDFSMTCARYEWDWGPQFKEYFYL